jgi:tetratricopeptide (TPR) repeat protein
LRRQSALILAFCLAWPVGALAQAGDAAQACKDPALKAKARIEACSAWLSRPALPIPDLEAGLTSRGLAHLELRDTDEAMTDLGHALGLDPRNARAMAGRGEAWAQRGDFTKALVDYDRAVALDPTLVEVWSGRGLVHYWTKAWDGAISDFTRAIAMDDSKAELWFFRALTWIRKGERAKAIEDLSQAIARKSDYSFAYDARGGLYGDQGDYERALADFDRVIALRGNPGDYAERCRLRATFGKELDLAADDCRRALAATKNDVDFRDDSALLHLKRGEYAEAAQDADARVRTFKTEALSLYLRGMAEVKLGRTDQGQADIRAAIAGQPNIEQAYTRWGIAP